jgi:hypothetical protein
VVVRSRIGGAAYQVGERVELLPHQAGFLAPARDFAVHEVEEEAERDEAEGEVEVGVVGGVGLDAVAQRGEDGHDAAEAWRLLAMHITAWTRVYGEQWWCGEA